MNQRQKISFTAIIGIALVVLAGVSAAQAVQSSRDRDHLARDMRTVRESVIPHSFAFTIGSSGQSHGKQTVVWASAAARDSGVRVGDEIHYRPIHGVAYVTRTQVNDVISEVEHPAVKPRAAAEGVFFTDASPGYVTVVLPRDVPMTLYLKHSDGKTVELMI